MQPGKKFRSPLNLRTLYRVVALVAAFASVEYFYDTVVDPRATEAEIKQALLKENDPEASGETRRSLAVIIKDTEQQICISLLIWAFLLILEKVALISGEQRCLHRSFLELGKGERIIPNNALSYYRTIRDQVEKSGGLRGKMLPQFLMNGLHRFHATHSISAVSESIQQDSDLASDQMDTDLSLIRYIGWAIPSIGFIGTVRGIGEALAQAEQAIEGDISGVTASLGLAFNSTLVALLLSIVLTFFVYMLQSAQENLILKTGRYCQEKLINAMKVPVVGEAAGAATTAAVPAAAPARGPS